MPRVQEDVVRRSRVLEASEVGLPADAELADRAAGGDTAAFEELYRRHAQSAWRVAQSVTGNRDDAADAVSDAFTRVFQALPAGRLHESGAFRPYLLAATRNAALDVLRRTGRVRPSDTIDLIQEPSPSAGPPDRVVDALDQSLVASAFLSLPERWRSVLWLTEVEGLPAREAAGMLGLSPNGVAQLAVRARAGLRERYLQAHLRGGVDDGCRFAVEHLGAYVAGGLAPRDIAKVDQHLAGCSACRDRKDELDQLGTTLRRVSLPIPVALAAISLNRFKAATSAATTVGRGPFALTPGSADKWQKGLSLATAGLLALGIIGLGIVNNPAGPSQRTRTRPAVPLVAPPLLQLPADQQTPDTSSTSSQRSFAGEVAQAAPPSGDETGAGASRPAGSTGPSAPPKSAGAPVAQATVRLGASAPSTAALAVGLGDASCVGADLGGTVVGCKPGPAAKPSSVVTVTTDGTALGSNTVSVP